MNHLSPENLTPKKAAADGVSSAAARPLKTPFRLSPEVRAFIRNPAGMAGLLLLITVFLMAALAPLLYPGDPLDMVAQPFLWPGENPDFPLGTDSMGRDVAAGIVHGSQVSLQIGFSAVIVSLLIGTVVGALAGYFGGRVDDLLVHITELFQTFPTFLLVVVLVAIGSPSVTLISLAIGIASWPTIARLVRAEFRSLRESDFVLAARSQGFSSLRIIFQEMLPNALPSIIVTTSVMVASAILIESALSFLGFGDPNRVSWGSMIGAGRESLRTAWFLTALPGTALVLTVLSLNLVGDALNDALNPRLRGRSA
ncbi:MULTISPECIES: ABC transporter permease [Pectobacterium]|uniref:ABC transporter permease n=1 Tax=Pectobacterium versatile TaxID=2488639 RepID=A0A7V8PCF2_9GAMM|nr:MULTISPECIES: ABC transporter permease [Pectobacterium]KGA37770.1 ABC transporter permease [Pectobacterium odoriferum]MBA0162801.1 ABC transporter permease [Pectobacterium versatile]MBA0169991.1 ABC transporter permease [Pectobacterium versatile]MBD0848790.1 ABC transporter permease [Pectobacterium carotovorum subsp. carotovorum]MBK4824945.1 Glutathione transport system permease protein GsiD [Pectobacterium carotovorum subsp. carotovorum]